VFGIATCLLRLYDFRRGDAISARWLSDPDGGITVDGTKLPPTAMSVMLIVPYVDDVKE
jgi:hypothetical protein